MNRRRRTEILVESPPDLAAGLADLVRDAYVVVSVIAPKTGLVMNQVRENAFGSRFYLGEALLTEARVRIGDVVGIGAVLGEKPELASDLAVIDAALSQPQELPIARQMLSALEDAEALLAQEREKEARLIATTRVDFSTMTGGAGDHGSDNS